MPMIDAEDLKTLSDAAQKAFQDWIESGQAQARARERGDGAGEVRSKATAEWNEKLYNQAARSLATQVNVVLAKVGLGYPR